MSYESDTLATAGAKLRNDHREYAQVVNSREEWTPEYKAQMIREDLVKVEAKELELRLKYEADEAKRTDALQMKLYRSVPGGDTAAYHAEIRRLQGLGGEELGKVYETAKLVGDKTTMHAAFVLADRNNWEPVVVDYLVDGPAPTCTTPTGSSSTSSVARHPSCRWSGKDGEPALAPQTPSTSTASPHGGLTPHPTAPPMPPQASGVLR